MRRRTAAHGFLVFGALALAAACGAGADGSVDEASNSVSAVTQAGIDACAGLAEGDACTFVGRHGEALAGSCHACQDTGTLACRPEGMGEHGGEPGERPEGDMMPPVAACAELAESDACSFIGRRGEEIAGTCMPGFEGTLICAPAGPCRR